MVRTVRATLYRLWPYPAFKRIRVMPVTVEGFMDLVRLYVEHMSEVRLRKSADVEPEEVLRSLSQTEICGFVDRVTDSEPVGYFSDWMHEKGPFGKKLSIRNFWTVWEASKKVNDWQKFVALIRTKPGNEKGKKGSLMSDVMLVSKVTSTPLLLVLSCPLEHFLLMCDALNLEARAEDPTIDPDCEPTPLDALAGSVPGLAVVH